MKTIIVPVHDEPFSGPLGPPCYYCAWGDNILNPGVAWMWLQTCEPHRELIERMAQRMKVAGALGRP